MDTLLYRFTKPNKYIAAFDLDGTLAIIDDRLKKSLMKNRKINWKRFFSEDLIKED